MRCLRRTLWLIILLLPVLPVEVSAQTPSFRREGHQFNVQRPITVPAKKDYDVVVVEFYHHGEITPDGRNVAVATAKEFVPTRILQVGPGDFCRLAFETVQGQSEYAVLYGGEPLSRPLPDWKNQDGLLLETRHYRNCNLRNSQAVRNAFEAAKPYGGDYVDSVMHACNPFSLRREPFLSRYSGYLNISRPGTYGFFTSSRDASFLLIDGKPVVSAPGRHPPRYRAFRGSRGDVKLAPGRHQFEYYHAAAGPEAVMSAAWEIDPTDVKPRKPTPLPPEVFHTGAIGRLPVGPPRLSKGALSPDFLVRIAGAVPLPDNPQPLVGASFRSVIPSALADGKIVWDFGDGQTGNLPDVDHVYLRPGLYTVKLTVRRAGRNYEMTNRVEVDRPYTTYQDKQPALDEYLQIVENYNPRTLDASSLLQLVFVYEAKALALQHQTDNVRDRVQDDPNRKPGTVPLRDNSEGDSRGSLLTRGVQYYWEKAVETGKTAFTTDSAAKEERDLLRLAEYVGPLARLKLGDSESALAIWKGADTKIQESQRKAECQIHAADVLINDFARAGEAKPLLDAASAALGGGRTGKVASALHRVRGDYFAATGDGPAAQKSYAAAEQALGPTRNFIERTARQGAHSRSTEEFLRGKQFDRAAEEIHSWLEEFPGARMDGYLTLQYAKYWAGRQKYDAAVAQAEQLQTVNPNSPYADRILLLAADCEMRRGRKDRALATLHALLQNHPGSPLVPQVKENLKILENQAEK
ncbi:MAG: PKD domain-containing protein [Pirellulales bacterium]|nr:PKD domain-containing protein [Pirellulales bacterium]